MEDTVTAVEVFERTRVGIEIDNLNLLSSKVEKSPESNNCEIQSKNIVNRHSHCERNILNLKIEKVQNETENKEKLISERTKVK